MDIPLVGNIRPQATYFMEVHLLCHWPFYAILA